MKNVRRCDVDKRMGAMKVKELIEELKKYNQEKEVHFIGDYFIHDSYIDISNRVSLHNKKSYEYLTILEVVRKPHLLKLDDIVEHEGVKGKVISLMHAASSGKPMCTLESLDNEELTCTVLQEKVICMKIPF